MTEPPPPSYREATERQDWLRIIAPYISVRDYASLCLVSKRFNARFAPRLWNDPVAVFRVVRPHADCDEELGWYHGFIRHVDNVRPATRCLVRSLDLRGFGRDESDFSLHLNSRAFSQTLERLPAKFPRLRCILLDGHPEANPNYLARNHPHHRDSPLLLSIPGCQAATLEPEFFASRYFSNLVYLDISSVPEAITAKSLAVSIHPGTLPRLCVLKAQGQSMGDTEVLALVDAFKPRIWSLDLSRNRLTDLSLRHHLPLTFPSANFRDLSKSRIHRFAVEGGLIDDPHSGTLGKSFLVVESAQSAGFTHPDRYIVDTPDYPGSQGSLAASRSDGRAAIRDHSATMLKQALSAYHLDDAEQHLAPLDSVFDLGICQTNRGTTHLCLNQNNISAPAIVSMLHHSPGHLEHFECDSMSFPVPAGLFPPWMPPTTKLTGLLGAAHIFRPVFSSNLQVLRIHHSLVTNLPSIRTEHLSEPLPTTVEAWLAETYLLPRADLAYPQTLVPDMNPRLRSLTLTKIPRLSTGPLIDKLIRFLQLLSAQERDIRAAKPSTRFAPQTLPGLRRLVLEFEPDPSQELEELQAAAEEEQAFSFFEDEASPSLVTARTTSESVSFSSQKESPPGNTPSTHPVPIFTSSSTPNPTPAVAAYTLLAQIPSLQKGIIPATPCHVAAGVPPGSYIYGGAWDAMLKPAWDAMLKPAETMARPGRADLLGMKDVLGAVREFRARTRARKGDGWWSGEVQVVRGEGAGGAWR